MFSPTPSESKRDHADMQRFRAKGSTPLLVARNVLLLAPQWYLYELLSRATSSQTLRL
jgi:hypothetical protein